MTGHPHVRPRRLRAAPWIRNLVRETIVTPADFIQPLFVVEGEGIRKPIAALPGVDHLSIDRVVETAQGGGDEPAHDHGLGLDHRVGRDDAVAVVVEADVGVGQLDDLLGRGGLLQRSPSP